MAKASKSWFAPKRDGYGAGLPVSWDGWAVLLLFVAGVFAATTLLDGIWRDSTIAGLIVTLLLIAENKTAGGWCWLRGDDL